MEKLRELKQQATAAFEGLSQNGQMGVVVGGIGGVALFFLIATALISSSGSSAERRIEQKSKQLREVLSLQGDYRAREAELRAKRNKLSRSKVRLVSVIDEAAAGAGVDIKEMKPSDGEADENGVVESYVELEARGMSIDRLQDFLKRLRQKNVDVVTIPKLKMSRPYNKETLNIEMRVVTYKVEAKG